MITRTLNTTWNLDLQDKNQNSTLTLKDKRPPDCTFYFNLMLKFITFLRGALSQQKVRDTTIKIYNNLALLTLSDEYESWTMKAKDKISLTDHKGNKNIIRRTKTSTHLNKNSKYEINWIQNVERMQRNWLPKILKKL